MSYCRFSSENWMCDVYVYEDVDSGLLAIANAAAGTPSPILSGIAYDVVLNRMDGETAVHQIKCRAALKGPSDG